MSDHLHLIWQPLGDHTAKQNQHNFLKYTAQQIKFHLLEHGRGELEIYRVKATDREFQFWERNSLSIELYSTKVFMQKLNYIHQNPVLAGLCLYPEEYHYSSAKFYETGIDDWGILSHYRG
jgi:REP element-mobilizing transposase RayT